VSHQPGAVRVDDEVVVHFAGAIRFLDYLDEAGGAKRADALFSRYVDPAEGDLKTAGKDGLTAAFGSDKFAYSKPREAGSTESGPIHDYWQWVIAALLAPAMEINVEALRRRAPESRALGRYDEVARLLTGNPHASAADGIEWIAALCRRFEIPPLRAHGVTAAHIPLLASRAAEASSMKANPIKLTREELEEIIGRAI